jgi:cytoskeletal protein CcmA (bactofilin family)
MFGKEVDTNVQEGRINSILGKGCKFKGTIEVEGTLRIDSEFEGVVNCPETLVVGKTGVVKADINVKNAIIGGKVIGNITASNKIELQSGSHIEGDITTHRLVIDEGVFFEGSCKMGEIRPGNSSTQSQPSSKSNQASQPPQPAKVGAGR